MSIEAVDDDPDVRTALSWLSRTLDTTFSARLRSAQAAYRTFTELDANRGIDPGFEDLGSDVVAAFFAQSQSLLDDRRSYDLALASSTIPWVKQLGRNAKLLDDISGARARASRMMNTPNVPPDSAMFELVMAANYAAEGLVVEFIDEAKGKSRTPDFKLMSDSIPSAIFLECKRVGRGLYEKTEQQRHRLLFDRVAALIYEYRLSVHIDVTYTRELSDTPDTYLVDHLQRALLSPIIGLRAYPWEDEYGRGSIRPAELAAACADIKKGSLYFGTKLARLLSGRVVRESGYHLAAGADPDRRDPRYIDRLYYGSVVTWQCIAPTSLEKKSRFVTKKLAEADEQLRGHGPAIVHLALDAELECESSDQRRARNIHKINTFVPTAELLAIYVHYLVPRISETHPWLIDETVDTFGPSTEPIEPTMIFPQSLPPENDLPAWRQPL